MALRIQTHTLGDRCSLPVQHGNFPTRLASASHTPTTTPSPHGDTMNSYPSPIIQVASVMERAPAYPRYSSRACKENSTDSTSFNVSGNALKFHQFHTLISLHNYTLLTTCMNCSNIDNYSYVGTTVNTDIPSLPYDLRDDEVAPIYLARERQPCPNGVRFPYPEGLGGPMTQHRAQEPLARVGSYSQHTKWRTKNAEK